MKNSFIKQIFSEPSEHGEKFSSKRTVVILGFIFMSIAFFANLFGPYTIEEYMFESMAYIVIAGFGFTGVEKFITRKKPEPENMNPYEGYSPYAQPYNMGELYDSDPSNPNRPNK